MIRTYHDAENRSIITPLEPSTPEPAPETPGVRIIPGGDPGGTVGLSAQVPGTLFAGRV
jgi:hypothetical protein